MKTATLILAVLLSLVRLAPAQTNNAATADAKPLPTIDFVLQQVVARAVSQEDKNDNLFDMNYQYTSHPDLGISQQRRRIEKPRGKTQRGKQGVAHGRQRRRCKPAAPPPVVKNEPLSETHSNIHGKALKVKDYSIPNLVKRFQFTLVGREMLNGRPSLVVDFKPLNDHLPVNQFADNFINKAAGRVWIDEEDYAIAQAQLHLTEQVNVLGGIVGAVWKFNYGFTRLRTPEGYWFARSMDWHLEGREVVINRIVDYHERKLDEQKIMTTASTR